MKNILEEANEIVNLRSQEKERQYGNFSEGMQRAAQIMSGMTGKDITAPDMYAALVALKLSRHSYSYKRDNLLDSVAYIAALDNYILEYGYDPGADPYDPLKPEYKHVNKKHDDTNK